TPGMAREITRRRRGRGADGIAISRTLCGVSGRRRPGHPAGTPGCTGAPYARLQHSWEHARMTQPNTELLTALSDQLAQRIDSVGESLLAIHGRERVSSSGIHWR